MSKFIANKVKVSFSSEAIRHQSAKQKKINVMDGGGEGGWGLGCPCNPFPISRGSFPWTNVREIGIQNFMYGKICAAIANTHADVTYGYSCANQKRIDS